MIAIEFTVSGFEYDSPDGGNVFNVPTEVIPANPPTPTPRPERITPTLSLVLLQG